MVGKGFPGIDSLINAVGSLCYLSVLRAVGGGGGVIEKASFAGHVWVERTAHVENACVSVDLGKQSGDRRRRALFVRSTQVLLYHYYNKLECIEGEGFSRVGSNAVS